VLPFFEMARHNVPLVAVVTESLAYRYSDSLRVLEREDGPRGQPSSRSGSFLVMTAASVIGVLAPGRLQRILAV
jgi:hypothetical protein